MITSLGKDLIMRYLAGYTPQIAESLSFGIGYSAESLDTTDLDFEINSQYIKQIGVNLLEKKLIFKVTIPAEVEAKIKEIGLWSGRKLNAGPLSTGAVSLFDINSENWTGGTWAADSRINGSTYRIVSTANQTSVAVLPVFSKDFSATTLADTLVIAAKLTSNVSLLRIDMGTDSANKYSFSLVNPGAGDQIIKIPFTALTTTGNPDWSKLSYLAVTLQASSAGSATVNMDGIKINYERTDGILVARKVLPTEIIKERNSPMDAEYIMEVDI